MKDPEVDDIAEPQMKMKEISFREGLLKLRVPADWKEVPQEGNRLAIRPPNPRDGMLGVEIYDLKADEDLTPENFPNNFGLAVHAILTPEYNGEIPISVTPTGMAMSLSQQLDEKERNLYKTVDWALGRSFAPRRLLVAVVSYTFQLKREKDYVIRRNLAMIRREAFEAKLGE